MTNEKFDEGTTQVVRTTSAVQEKYLSITAFPKNIEIEQGKTKTEKITVNNDNNVEFQDVTLKVNEINSTWINVLSGMVNIEPLQSYIYDVKFDIPKDAEVKDYSGEFVASSSFETKRQSFTLSVSPGDDLKVTINMTIEDYQKQIQQLEKDINLKKKQGYNTTEAEKQLQDLKTEFNKLLAFRDGGNYKSAYGLLDETKNLLNQTSSKISGAFTLSSKQLLGTMQSKLVFSGLVVLFIGTGIYTFWGKHFKINEKLWQKIRKRMGKKIDSHEKELDAITKEITKTEYNPIPVESKQAVKPEVSERMAELDAIKRLVKGTTTDNSYIHHKEQ